MIYKTKCQALFLYVKSKLCVSAANLFVSRDFKVTGNFFVQRSSFLIPFLSWVIDESKHFIIVSKQYPKIVYISIVTHWTYFNESAIF